MSKRTVLWTVAGLALVATAAMAAPNPPVYQSAGNLSEGESYNAVDPRPLTEGA